MSTAHANHWPVHRLAPALDQEFLTDAAALLADATAADGTPSISEQAVIAMRSGGNSGDEVRVYAAYAPEDPYTQDPRARVTALAGYAVAVTSEGTTTVEIAVHPNFRNKGVALRIVNDMHEDRGGLENVQAWSHGDSSAAEDLAAQFGFEKVRELWRMRLSTANAFSAPGSVAETPGSAAEHDAGPDAGYSIRTFVPGQDEQAWLAANREAFADHPEQGSLTALDLAERMAEPWFDPKGFFLAVDAEDRILGFHWTKMEAARSDTARTGEVYVVGIRPEAQGRGLGKVLTSVGLRYLADRGAHSIILYTEAENTAAVRLYHSLGFTHWDSDVMYRKSPTS